MKRLFLTIMAALTLTLSASAQRLLDVRGEAQYITDKMALELALTPSQRNSILQLNLTYLNGITSYRDIETTGWKYRNKHMKALLETLVALDQITKRQPLLENDFSA